MSLYRFTIVDGQVMAESELHDGVWVSDPLEAGETATYDAGSGTVVLTELRDGYNEVTTFTLSTGSTIDFVETGVVFTDLAGNPLTAQPGDDGSVDNPDDTDGDGVDDDHVEGDDADDDLSGLAGDDSLDGNGGDDFLAGGVGDDTLSGGADDDSATGGDDDDIVSGGSGNDTVSGGNGSDDVLGGSGSDFVYGGAGNDSVLGGADDDTVSGGAGDDSVSGGTGNDDVLGGGGNDSVSGGAGNDDLYGGAGRDVLVGGSGADQLYGGSDKVRDVFDFNATSESRGTGSDDIHQFKSGVDDIDLRTIDANSALAGNQAFVWGGTKATAHGVWVVDTGADMRVFADVNGDKVADFSVDTMGVSSIVASDFML